MILKNADDIAIANFFISMRWSLLVGCGCIAMSLYIFLKTLFTLQLLQVKILLLISDKRTAEDFNYKIYHWISPLWLFFGLVILLWK